MGLRLASAPLVVVLAVGLGLTGSAAGRIGAPVHATVATTTSTFTPAADTYVESDTPTTNYGTKSSVYVDGSPGKKTLLVFPVSGLSGTVVSAKLRLYCKSDASVFGGEVHRVADTGWSETSVTWNTAPAVNPPVLGALGAVSIGAWYEIDVTGSVVGNGAVAYALISANSDGVNYASREAGSSTAPQLIVTTQTTADTTPPSVPTGPSATATSANRVALSWTASTDNVAVTGYSVFRNGVQIGTSPGASYTDSGLSASTSYTYTVDAFDAAGNHSGQSSAASVTTPAGQTSFTFAPTDDTYVQSDTPGTNYGGSNSFYEDGSPFKHALLKFSVGGISGTVLSAKLRLYCKSDPSVFGGELHQVTDTSWAEKAVTWTTAPAMNSAVVATLGAVNAGSWYEVDVTPTVTGNGTVSYKLVSNNSDGANFASKEGGAATAPQLVVTVTSSMTDTTPPAVDIANPPNGSTVVGTGVTVSANASDNVAVAVVQFKLDGANLGPAITNSPFAMAWDSTTVANGSHSLTATATDMSGNTGTSAVVTFTVSNSQTGPCALMPTPPATYNHVVWVWFENKSYNDVFGSAVTATPYEKSLLSKCGSSTNYLDNVVPSMPSLANYLAATSGSNCVTGLGVNGTGCIIDNDPPSVHTLSTASIFELLTSAGKTWRAYQEAMPSNCARSSNGSYAVRHNPPPYYSRISDDCSVSDVPFPAISCSASSCTTPAGGSLLTDVNNGTLPAFAFVTPGLCNDTHDCGVGIGDQWLQTWLPRIFAGPNYRSGDTAVFVMWDEGSAGQPMPNLFITPYTTPTSTATAVNHFAVLRATQNMLGIAGPGYLGCAGGTVPGTGAACPNGWNADVRSLFHF